MDTMIRNLDAEVYRMLKARAVLTGRTIGEATTEAMRAYVSLPAKSLKKGRLTDLMPEDWGPGTETSSRDVDRIVYGV